MSSLKECVAKFGKSLDSYHVEQIEALGGDLSAVQAYLDQLQTERSAFPLGDLIAAFDTEAEARKFIKKKGAVQFTRQDVIDFVRSNGVQIEEVVADQDQSDELPEFEWEEDIWEEANDEAVDIRMEDYDDGHDDPFPDGLDGWANENVEVIVDELSRLFRADVSEFPRFKDFVSEAIQTDMANELEPIFDEMKVEMDETIRQLARGDAEEIYQGYVDDTPYQMVTVEGIDESKARITGNDDIGWYWYYKPSPSMTYEDTVSSLEEAKIQLMEQLRDYGELDEQMGDENAARWGNNIDHYEPASAENYREIKITLPNNPETFVESAHFDDENIVAFLRVTDRDDMMYIDEFQSDWHQQGARQGYDDAERADKQERFKEIEQELDDAYEDVIQKLPTNSEGFIKLPDDILMGSNGVEVNLIEWVEREQHEVWAEGNDTQIHLQRWFVDNITPEQLSDLRALQAEMYTLRNQLRSNPVPDAPFKGNSWVSLGLKRAIIHAVENGYDQLAWADAAANSDRWDPDINKYKSHYDEKMPSIVKKLTGVEPQHFDMAGDPYPEMQEDIEAISFEKAAEIVSANGHVYALNRDGSTSLVRPRDSNTLREDWGTDRTYYEIDPNATQPNGYWSIPITEELKAKVRDEGFSMFQDNRGEIQLVDDKRIIKLSESSDPSTFIHEMAHLFLEVEKQFAGEFGINDKRRSMLEWLGLESFDDLDLTTSEGVELHEKFARAFEAYLYEGKAPSISLRDAFATIKTWLLRVYESIKQLNVELDDSIRDVFDRMLTTQAEREAATSNPVYDQYFSSAEAAGMTPAEFAAYEERKQKRDNRATEQVDTKLMTEYRKRREKEWREEREPLIDEEYERISKERVYQLIGDLSIAPMKYDDVVAVTGKLPGKLIGKASNKEDAVDPQEYAEAYGYNDIKEMLDEIASAPSLKKAAQDAAQARMIEKYGDIMNDGSLEYEIQDALHNDDQAAMLLMELKALKPESANKINRDYLKAEAKRVISEMKYKEISPNKYYRNEVRAAKRAGEARPDMKAEIFDAKVSQLANHYLYREAVEVKARMLRDRRYVKATQKRKYDPKAVETDFIANIKALATLYDMSDNPVRQKQHLSGLLSWFNDAVARDDIELQLMEPNLVLAMGAKKLADKGDPSLWSKIKLPSFDDLTAADLKGLTDMLKHMRYVGGQMSEIQNSEIAAERVEINESIDKNGGRNVRDPERGHSKDSPWDYPRYLFNLLPSMRNMVRRLDNNWDNKGDQGVVDKYIFRRLEDATNKQIELKNEIYDRFREELQDIHYLGLSGVNFTTEIRRKYGIPHRNDVTMTKEDGRKVTMNPEEMFMLALYWGTASSRDAIREGHGMTDYDVMQMLSNLTEDQLRMVNKVWAINESIWSDLSSASIKRYGVSPEKLEATPFIVNGVEMTGGHMRLFYNSQEIEIKNEQESGSEYASIMPSKAGSLHARVGSGGRPVLLDRNNIVRAIDENIHFIAFAETGNHIRRLVSSRETQELIQRKHGKPFHRAFVEQLDMLIRNKPINPSEQLAPLFRLARKNATFMHLVFSIRNIVQQFSAIPIAASEVGTLNIQAAALQLAGDGGETAEFIRSKSTFMKRRTDFVNREATEYLNQVSVDGPVAHVWRKIADIGFTPQTFIDSLIAYPTWFAKYEIAMNTHGDERRAISEADIAVSESIGSGADLHMGGAFNSNTSELTRTMTLFGSWFNAYYQRVYRSTKGGSDFRNLEAFQTIVTMPLIVGTLSALLVMDMPDDDSEEDWLDWAIRQYVMFTAGTIPLVRDVATLHYSGFSPKTVVAGLQESIVRAPAEIASGLEGRQSGLKTAADLLRVTGTFVPIPGSGQIARTMDFIDSNNQGEETSELKLYQALVEGPDRNE